jgi:hypothetical protein
MIFSVDKYKAYQNVSLQLFDQESLIILPEEEGKKGVINDNKAREAQVPQSSESLRPSMHMSFAGGCNSNSSQFNWDAFKMQVLLGNQDGAIETLQKFKFSDILFFRVVPESSDLKFLEGAVNGQHLNILQFAVAQG